MAISNSTSETTGNDATYVSETYLADAWMFLANAIRLIDPTDSLAACLLDKAMDEIIAAQDYLEAMDPIKSPISEDVAAMLGQIGKPH